MKILITGGSGFFGQNLLKAFRGRNEPFECFNIYNSKASIEIDDRFKWLQSNLLDKEKIQKLLKEIKPTHCIHLAWYVPPQKFWTASENIDWLNASAYLFQEFCKNGGQVFVSAGSLAEYDWNSGILDEEKTPLLPSTLYGQCKKSLHEIMIKYRDAHSPQTQIIWPRIGYFFGPGEPKEKLISKLIHSIKNNIPMDLTEPNFSRPYAHIKYWGEVMTQILFNNLKNDLTFNMSANKAYNLKEIVDYLKEKCQKQRVKLNFGAYPSSPVSLLVKTDFLQGIVGADISNTFFQDLKELIENKYEEF